MDNENKDKAQAQEREFDVWNEEQFYRENIVPKMNEIAELCKSRQIPFLFHVHYSHNESNTGVGTHGACFGKKSIQSVKIGACGRILSKEINEAQMAMLAAVALSVK